ncbi:MAG TPA: hypothetical protein VHL34_23520 [Rhizomicrobium sp.]|jgi:ElaB/YqjD/DUF883 family membrane-anchored ribosome-binding protein|nr:hypothetical protein [Rhizomicrobium sp.]
MVRRKTSKGSQHVEKRIAALRDDIDSIQEDMKGLADGVGDVAGEQVNGARSYVDGVIADTQSYAQDRVSSAQKYAQARLNKVLSDAQDMVDRLSDETEVWASDNAETARETIRNQPLAACVLALSAGALIGALLLRR